MGRHAGTNPHNTPDDDGDGLYDVYERDYGTSDRLADTDGDGWDDWEEYVYVAGTAGSDASDTPDDDGDGLYDVYEVASGTDDTLADTDGDGADDYLEYVYGSDGTDPTSVP